MLYGVTEWETYHSLDPVSLTYGMLEGERNEHLRKFMYARYEALPYFALATTLSEYLVSDNKNDPPPTCIFKENSFRTSLQFFFSLRTGENPYLP